MGFVLCIILSIYHRLHVHALLSVFASSWSGLHARYVVVYLAYFIYLYRMHGCISPMGRVTKCDLYLFVIV